MLLIVSLALVCITVVIKEPLSQLSKRIVGFLNIDKGEYLGII